MTRRLAIAFFYDENHMVDDYLIHLIRELKPFVDHTIFVSNGQLTKNSEIALRGIADEVIARENTGFDVWAYKTALEHVGYDNLKNYDELLLYNHTFYGPIFPFSEMFEEMGKRSDDFWGITMHGELKTSDYSTGPLPEHINSHFIAIRHPMLDSIAFRRYWDEMEPINSYGDSVVKHESRFTKHFERLGYRWSTYIDLEGYGSLYPIIIDIDRTIAKRNPILKRRSFFLDSGFVDANAVDLPRALRTIRAKSDYDVGLIWKNIVRGAAPRVLNTDAALTSVLPDEPLQGQPKPKPVNIVVCAHIYYVDMVDEILDSADTIPFAYDFVATTDSPEKKKQIETIARTRTKIANIEVRTCR